MTTNKPALLAAIFLAACAADTDQTRDEACREQAEVFCGKIGHPNGSCEIGYYYRCAPAGIDLERIVKPHLQDACLDAMVCDVDAVHNAVPEACALTWRQL